MKQISEAFVKFQSDLKPVVKGSVNPFYKNNYADLSSILEEVMPILNKHGLGLSQTCRVVEQGTILQTRIIHVSGEEILSECVLPFLSDVQKMGSQITYYKRYMVQAALGVSTADEDDDGRKASAPSKKPQERAATTSKNTNDIGDFSATVGKYKGKRLKEIEPRELVDYCKYITAGTSEVTGPMKAFIDNARTYLSGASA